MVKFSPEIFRDLLSLLQGVVYKLSSVDYRIWDDLQAYVISFSRNNFYMGKVRFIKQKKQIWP